jgi:hypothetical protein
VRDSLIALGREVAFEVEVQNFGANPRNAEPIELYIDGRRTHQQTLDLRAGGKAATVFMHQFDLPGEHQIEARLGGDVLPVDDHRYYSLPVRESHNVLCVQGVAGETQHLVIALAPSKSEQPLVRPTVVSESALLEKDLTRYDAVFLANIGRVSRDEAATLRRYVNQGGGLVIFLGDAVQLDTYNEHFANLDADRVLPARLTNLAPTSIYKVNPLDYRHPIVAAFAGHERAGLLTTPVFKYVKLAPVDPGKSRVALAFDNGDPAIITEEFGRGRVALVATAASSRSVDNSVSPAPLEARLPADRGGARPSAEGHRGLDRLRRADEDRGRGAPRGVPGASQGGARAG